MSRNNSGHISRSRARSSEDDYADFERLPPRLREAISLSAFNMTSDFPLRLLRSGVREEDLIKMLEERMQELHEEAGGLPRQIVRPIIPRARKRLRPSG
jgi:hypothetical protein